MKSSSYRSTRKQITLVALGLLLAIATEAPAGEPQIGGVRLGDSPEQARARLTTLYPTQAVNQQVTDSSILDQTAITDLYVYFSSESGQAEKFEVFFTLPPEEPRAILISDSQQLPNAANEPGDGRAMTLQQARTELESLYGQPSIVKGLENDEAWSNRDGGVLFWYLDEDDSPCVGVLGAAFSFKTLERAATGPAPPRCQRILAAKVSGAGTVQARATALIDWTALVDNRRRLQELLDD